MPIDYLPGYEDGGIIGDVVSGAGRLAGKAAGAVGKPLVAAAVKVAPDAVLGMATAATMTGDPSGTLDHFFNGGD